MTILGIDYGKKKIGFAVSEGELAEPLKVVDISGLKDAIFKTLKIIREEGAGKIVIGIPESGEALAITRKFISNLKLEIKPVEIVEVDETLTSQAAQQKMVELNIPQGKRTREDAYSAAYLLQNYLNGLSV